MASVHGATWFIVLCYSVDGADDDGVEFYGVDGVDDADGIGSDSETWPGCSIALWPWPVHPRLGNSKTRLRWIIHRFSYLLLEQ